MVVDEVDEVDEPFINGMKVDVRCVLFCSVLFCSVLFCMGRVLYYSHAPSLNLCCYERIFPPHCHSEYGN